MIRRLYAIVQGRAWLLAPAAVLLVALWLLRPAIATAIEVNLGSLALNHALLTPDLTPADRQAWATKAGRRFETALAWDPLNDSAYAGLAVAYGVWEDGPSVAQAASRAAALNPGDAIAHFRNGQALAALGSEQRAIEEWQAAGAAEYFVNEGLALALSGDNVGAVAQYRRALAVDPSVPDCAYHLAQALVALGRHSEAIEVLEAGAALAPVSSARYHLLQGQAHVMRGEWVAALIAFEAAATLDLASAEPIFQQGRVLEQGIGDPEDATKLYQLALEREPDHTASRLALARLLGELGDCRRAASWLEPMLARSDADARREGRVAAQTWALVGACLVDAGRPEDALPFLERAAVVMPTSVRYRLDLGRAHSLAGRYADAIDAYVDALGLDPDNTEAHGALEELGWREP
jgi:tetratricopeptide (TPR) repeat protein